MSNIESGTNWCERIRRAMLDFRGQEIATGEIVRAVKRHYPGANEGNVLPGDHCEGRPVKVACPYCQDPNRTIFRQIARGRYQVLGASGAQTTLLQPSPRESMATLKPIAPVKRVAIAALPSREFSAASLAGDAWVPIGDIKTASGLRNAFTHVPDKPGLYKITFTMPWGKAYSYIGETGRLRGRIGEYARTPTQGTVGEHLMFDILTASGVGELSICRVGLEPRKARLEAETAAIAQARRRGLTCINRGEDLDHEMKQFRLQSAARMHAKELESIQSKLAGLRPP